MQPPAQPAESVSKSWTWDLFMVVFVLCAMAWISTPREEQSSPAPVEIYRLSPFCPGCVGKPNLGGNITMHISLGKHASCLTLHGSVSYQQFAFPGGIVPAALQEGVAFRVAAFVTNVQVVREVEILVDDGSFRILGSGNQWRFFTKYPVCFPTREGWVPRL